MLNLCKKNKFVTPKKLVPYVVIDHVKKPIQNEQEKNASHETGSVQMQPVNFILQKKKTSTKNTFT